MTEITWTTQPIDNMLLGVRVTGVRDGVTITRDTASNTPGEAQTAIAAARAEIEAEFEG